MPCLGEKSNWCLLQISGHIRNLADARKVFAGFRAVLKKGGRLIKVIKDLFKSNIEMTLQRVSHTSRWLISLTDKVKTYNL
jgi:hypothetical protein